MITDGTVDPDTTTVDYLETYTVVCDTGHTVSAAGPMNCQADGTLDTTLTCDSKLSKKFVLVLMWVQSTINMKNRIHTSWLPISV